MEIVVLGSCKVKGLSVNTFRSRDSFDSSVLLDYSIAAESRSHRERKAFSDWLKDRRSGKPSLATEGYLRFVRKGTFHFSLWPSPWGVT